MCQMDGMSRKDLNSLLVMDQDVRFTLCSQIIDKPGLKVLASIFINLEKVKHARLAARLNMDVAPGDKIYFELSKPPVPLTIEWFGDQSGQVHNKTLDFDLTPFCGMGTLEFRMVFRSRSTSQTQGYQGVLIDRLNVVSS